MLHHSSLWPAKKENMYDYILGCVNELLLVVVAVLGQLPLAAGVPVCIMNHSISTKVIIRYQYYRCYCITFFLSQCIMMISISIIFFKFHNVHVYIFSEQTAHFWSSFIFMIIVLSRNFYMVHNIFTTFTIMRRA